MTVTSPSKSLKGWSFKKWFVGNWKTIKELGKVVVPAMVTWTTTNSPEMTILVTAGAKFLLDVGEYYFKSYRD